MRSIFFRVAYWLTSIFFVLTSIPLLLIPSRKPVMWWILRYTKTMCFWMETIGGIQLQVIGKDKLPEGPCIIAAKHQSWGDGFFMFSQFYDLAFVTRRPFGKISNHWRYSEKNGQYCCQTMWWADGA